LDKSDTVVWQIPLAVSRDELNACRGLLSEEEHARAKRFHFDWLERRFAVAHGRMRTILAQHTGVAPKELRYRETEYGKPFLDASLNTYFNLSHSDELAILAIAADDLGADVEFIRPMDDFEKVAEGFFSEHEVAALREYPEAERLRAFYRCWTRKEAFVKAIGEGLSIPLGSFAVSLDEHDALLLEASPPERAAGWTISALDLGADYVGAVATRGPGAVEMRWWNGELP
jgi:4'-phosphopantetheinyl transferase